MPKLDNFSIGNYGLGGVSQGEYQVVTISSNVSGTVSVPAGQTNYIVYLVANIPAQTKLISISLALGNPAIFSFSSNNLNPVRLALLDANNVMWPLTQTASGNSCNLCSGVIDLNANSLFLQNIGNQTEVTASVAWNPYSTVKPVNFDTTRNMRLAIIASNSAASTLNSSYTITNFKITSV